MKDKIKKLFLSSIFLQYFGIYYIVSVVTVIISHLISGGAFGFGWNEAVAYTTPFELLLISLFSLLGTFTNWVTLLMITPIVILLFGTVILYKKKTKKTKLLSYACWILFSAGFTLLTMAEYWG